VEFLQLGGDRGRAAVDLHDEVRVSGWKGFGTKPLARGFEREGVGDFQRGRQVAGVENRLHGGGGHRELGKMAASIARHAGFGISRSVASVTTPSMPSDPVKRPTRSKPVLFL
jgi:hypothetical protein